MAKAEEPAPGGSTPPPWTVSREQYRADLLSLAKVQMELLNCVADLVAVLKYDPPQARREDALGRAEQRVLRAVKEAQALWLRSGQI